MLALLTIFFINASSTPNAPGASGSAKNFSLEAGETISVSRIEFSGNKEIPTAVLNNLAKPFLNRTLSSADLAELKERVILLYQSRGFDEVKVKFPAKQKSGSLYIMIQEGKKTT